MAAGRDFVVFGLCVARRAAVICGGMLHSLPTKGDRSASAALSLRFGVAVGIGAVVGPGRWLRTWRLPPGRPHAFAAETEEWLHSFSKTRPDSQKARR
jgi:hypothetical protein